MVRVLISFRRYVILLMTIYRFQLHIAQLNDIICIYYERLGEKNEKHSIINESTARNKLPADI